MSNMNGIKGINPQGNFKPSTGLNRHITWRRWTLLGRAVLLLATVMPAMANPSTPGARIASASALPNHVPEQILVKPKWNVAETEVQALFGSHGAAQVDAIPTINLRLLHVPEARLEIVLAALQKHSSIAFAELNSIYEPALVPNDTYYSFAWHLPKIQAPQAWDITTGSSNVIIAILDTGVESTHPDLAPKIVAGWNFYDNNVNTADVTGHGTMVAGGAAAMSNNGMGVASPAWGALIMPVRISDATGSASDLTIAKALSWVADQGVRVANISYAISQSSAVSSAAQYLQSKGGVVTVAAGNGSSFITAPDNPYVLTVSATDNNDLLCSFSNTGSNIDIAAPGSGIPSTGSGGSYVTAGGTSLSAPVVAGVAALVISVNPNLTGIQVRSLLEQTADDLGSSGWDPQFGYGRVNAYKAVIAAGGNGTDTTPPAVSVTSPTSGSTVSATISVSVSATDNVGVTKVEWYLDGALAGSSATATVSFSWNTTSCANGSHNLQAKAYDAAGNVGSSTNVTVTVQNDTTAPTAQITAPVGGSTVAGTIPVNVSASDNVGVTKVELYLDGALAASSTSAPASFSWNTTASTNGAHALKAKAYDAAGNVGSSLTINVTVQNPVPDTTPPSAQIVSPLNGATISGVNSVNISASDNVGVVKVEWYLDGTLGASSTNSSPAFSWDTTTCTNGTHTSLAKAYDAAGNTGTSASVTVTVQNPVRDTTPPTVSVTAPVAGATVSGMITVNINASDNVGVTKVEWYIDGSLAGSTTNTPASFSWKTTGASNGSHIVQAKAYDAAGNVGVSSLVTVTVQNALKAPPASQITSPSAGAAISTKSTKVYVAATDGVGVTRVDLLVDGKVYSSNMDSAPTPSWNTTFNWNTSKLARGSHTLQSIAYDASGYTGGSTLVTVYK
jgi:subtilisin family serine protease